MFRVREGSQPYWLSATPQTTISEVMSEIQILTEQFSESSDEFKAKAQKDGS
jgi:hypothetical protein